VEPDTIYISMAKVVICLIAVVGWVSRMVLAAKVAIALEIYQLLMCYTCR
jgi:hypothetical protein